MYLRPPVSNNPAFEAAVILEHLLQRAMLSPFIAAVHAYAPTPPVFATQYSGRVNETLHQVPSGYSQMICDHNYDAVANMTSYRNCGWKGTQMQQVIRFGTEGGGPDAKIFYVYGHGPGGEDHGQEHHHREHRPAAPVRPEHRRAAGGLGLPVAVGEGGHTLPVGQAPAARQGLHQPMQVRQH